jgi:hypothetical protein
MWMRPNRLNDPAIDDGSSVGSIAIPAEFAATKGPEACTDRPLARMTGESVAGIVRR